MRKLIVVGVLGGVAYIMYKFFSNPYGGNYSSGAAYGAAQQASFDAGFVGPVQG